MLEEKDWIAAQKARYGAALYEKIAAATVAVCGLGGLGSHIAVSLARAGVGKLILMDFDRVDITNLNRQQYKAAQIGRYKTEAMAENLKEIAPCVQAEIHTVRLTEQNIPVLLKDVNVICEAFDKAEAKAMLTDTVLSSLPQSFLVAASGMAGLGSGNAIQTRRITNRFYLCGDGAQDAKEAPGLLCPRVMLCAAHQAQTVLRILAEEYEV